MLIFVFCRNNLAYSTPEYTACEIPDAWDGNKENEASLFPVFIFIEQR